MCIFAGLGLLFIGGGVHAALSGDIPIGIIITIFGLVCLHMVWEDWQPSYIPSHVENKIIAHDGNGRYLVEAETSRQILGPRPHVSGNLPAGLYKVKEGLWIVDSANHEPNKNMSSKINWIPSNGYHIEPRGNTQTGGFLRDVVEGYEHDYIVRDK